MKESPNKKERKKNKLIVVVKNTDSCMLMESEEFVLSRVSTKAIVLYLKKYIKKKYSIKASYSNNIFQILV